MGPRVDCFFFFNDTATTEIYTLSLHDALPISERGPLLRWSLGALLRPPASHPFRATGDRKSTRLNSSHGYISYAVFCLKKKNTVERVEVSLEETLGLEVEARMRCSSLSLQSTP